MKPDWPLETERPVLRPFEEGDLDALYAIQSDEYSVRCLDSGAVNPAETQELPRGMIARLRSTVAQQRQSAPGVGSGAVTPRACH